MNTSTIKRFLFVVFTAISVSLMVSESAEGGRLSPGLQRSAIDNPDECVTALVFFTPDIEEKVSLSASLKFISTFSDRYKKAHSKLMSASRKSFNAFFSELGEDGVGLQIKKKFWIANAVEITAKRADLARLAEFESVDLIVEDTVLELVEPVEVSDPSISLGSSGAEQNLVAINADKLWKQGLTGAGRLVMSFDTGVDGDHPGLADRWRGATSGNPSAAWFDVLGTDFPDDNVGHGTHVMGLMAGVFNGDTVGVAPDVEWGCAAVVDRGSGFSQTISDILSAFEWAADPDGNPETTDDLPDVICHSWGIPKGIFDPCDNTFWQAIDNLEQLGIVNIFACGNEGPDGGTIRNPADRASSPLNSFSVGAVNQNVLGYPVANFSSRGPANCDSTIIKPEIVAPGVLIKSLYPNASTKLMSGTSMAAPQVAGAVALLRQYNPNATVEQIKQALLLSATDIGEQGEDNASGFGLIDLEKALDYMPAPNRAVMEFSTFEITDDGNGVIEPDVTARLITEIRIRNHDVVGLWGVLRSEDSSVTVLTDSVYFGNLSAGVLVTNHSEPFIVHADQNITPGSVVTFRLDFSDESGAPLNYVYFGIVMAQGQNAASASMDNGQIAIGDCNYGMVGLGPRSIVDMGEAGFSIDSTNYLAEFALIVSDSEGRVSDAGRNITGLSSDNDFLAGEGAILMTFPEQSWGDLEMTGRFTDGLAEDAIGVDVKQTVSLFYEGDLSSAAFVSYSIGNIDPFAVHELSVGLVVDIDFYGDEQGLEMIDIDPNTNFSQLFGFQQCSITGFTSKTENHIGAKAN